MISKQVWQKEELKKFGQEYYNLKKDINFVFSRNQEIMTQPTFPQTDNYILHAKTIKNITQTLLKLLKKKQGNIFCALLQQIQLRKSDKTPFKSLLSKLIQSLIVFLKFKKKFIDEGAIVWDTVKYLFCYKQTVKDTLNMFRKDMDLIEKLRDLYVYQFKNHAVEAMNKLKTENSWLTDGQTAKNWLNFFKLSKRMIEASRTKNYKQMNKIMDQLLQTVPLNLAQQIQYNNLKQFYEQQLLKANANKRPCCSLFFQKDEKFPINSHKYNDYSEINLPLTEQQKNTIRKVMVSFMNTDGGIHYIGIKKEKEDDHLSVKGVWMNDTRIIQLFDEVYKIACETEPKNEVHLPVAPRIPNNINEKIPYILQLTRFVSLEINTLIEKENGNVDFVEENSQKKVIRISIAKIKVKSTPKYDTYMAKTQKSVKSWIRREGEIKQVFLSHFLKLFTERSTSYINEENTPGNPDCPNCRHNYSLQNN